MEIEEKRRKQREYMRLYYQKHKEKIIEINKKSAIKNAEKVKDRQHKWYLDNKERILENIKSYRIEHKEELDEKRHQYYLNNKESINKKNREKTAEFRKTKIGRAKHLIDGYKNMDRERGFGDVIDFDVQWIVDNIFTKPCAHCGESDWRKIGCNRLDNSKPHTMDNVEPCCKRCNSKLGRKYQLDF